MHFLRVFLLSLALASVAAGGAAAQTPGPAAARAATAKAAAKADAARLKALIATLEDETERKKLVAQLETLLAAQERTQPQPAPAPGLGDRVLNFTADRLGALGERLFGTARAVTDLPRLWNAIVEQAGDPAKRARWIDIAWKLLAVIGAGLVTEWLVRHLLRAPRTRLEAREVESWSARLLALFGRTVLDITPILGFLGAAYLAMSVVVARETVGAVMLILIAANVLARTVLVVGRMVLAPRAPGLRPLPIADADANYLFIWLRRLVEVPIYAVFVIQALERMGMEQNAAKGLSHLVGLLITLLAVVFILQNRIAVARWLRGGGESGPGLGDLRARLADIWHVLAVIYVLAVFCIWSLDIDGGFEYILRASVLTLLILVVARLLTVAFRRLAHRLFSLNDDMSRRFPGLEARANRYLPILNRVAAALIAAAAAIAILEAWGANAFDWLESPFGRRLTSGLITVAVIVVVSVITWELIDAAIARYLGRAEDPEAAIGPRARTLLPLLRTSALVVLVTIVVLVTLSELGVNIGPLLAGAGVIGLAIGFGSQALVKDIITGMFILIEDQVAVGDVVKIGSHAGVVETLTLRTLRLRDLAGVVHIVPFSEVTTIENMTKEFSRYVFNVGVAYREDTDQVVEVLHEIGQGMLDDDAWREDIVQPLEVLGVDSFGDNAVVIKARITTKPIRQWAVGREFNRRMKMRFDELGIEIPFPHRTLYFGEDKEGYAPPARIARAAKPRTDGGAAGGGAPAPAVSSDANLPTPGAGGADLPDGA